MNVPPLEWMTIFLDSCQQHGIRRNIWHELCQIFHKAHKLLYLVQVPWRPPIPYPGHLVHIGMYAMVIDDMSKAVHPLSVQMTFIDLEVEPKLPQ